MEIKIKIEGIFLDNYVQLNLITSCILEKKIPHLKEEDKSCFTKVDLFIIK